MTHRCATVTTHFEQCKLQLNTPVPYSTYYKPMGDLPYISSEQGELIIHNELIYKYTMYKLPIPVQEL